MSDTPREPLDISFHVSPAEESPDAKKEQRIMPKTIAHAFVLKSANAEYIKEKIAQGVPLKDLQFSYTIFSVENGGITNAALSPIGHVALPEGTEKLRGKGKRERELRRRIGDELFDAGYIRGTQYEPFYRREVEEDGAVVQERFVATEASPFDTLYRLGPNNTGKEYRFLTGEDLRHFARSGKLEMQGAFDTHEKTPIPDTVINKLMDELRKAEMVKKKDVLRSLMLLFEDRYGCADPAASKEIIEKINDASTPLQAERLFTRFIGSHSVAQEEILEALTLANLIEEIRQLDEYCGPIEATLRLIGIMHQLKSLPPKAFTVLKQSKNLAPYIRSLMDGALQHSESDPREFSYFLVSGIEGLQSAVQSLDAGKEGDVRTALEILEQTFGIPSSEFYDLSSNYDSFSKKLSEDIIRRALGKKVSASEADPLNDVRSENPVELLQTACGVGEIVDKYEKEKTEATETIPDRLMFEARWKLFCLKIMREVFEHHREKMKEGHYEFRKIWRAFESIPRHPIKKYPIYDAHTGALLDVITDQPQDAHTFARYTELQEQGEARIDDWQNDIMRELDLGKGIKILIRIDVREIKDPHSQFRKRLHGKGKPRDLFAREITVVFCPSKLLERTYHKVLLFEDEEKNVEGASLVEGEARVNDHAVVFEIIQAFEAKVNEALGTDWECRLYDYDPTPEGQDYRFEGKRPGSGGKIRFSKFTFIIRNKKTGREDAEEVQIFVPGFGKSGFYYLEEKKDDDYDFQVRRYLERYGIRSLSELRFPHSLYPKLLPSVHRKRREHTENESA
ncbi:hypothetical protein HY621_01340 [Candidatus Uhrbacteria bacterium]|nr:hypothetical protein [Candidatus Uhrbacteria bacterium]